MSAHPVHVPRRAPTAATLVFDLLNPIPFGFFVGALIFDLMYARTAEVMWFKSAAWLISIGLLIAVVPRLINLVQVWSPRALPGVAPSKAAFFVYLIGIVAAIVNAFVHSRDAYSIMPEGLWLSALTVLLLAAAHILASLQRPNAYRQGHA